MKTNRFTVTREDITRAEKVLRRLLSSNRKGTNNRKIKDQVIRYIYLVNAYTQAQGLQSPLADNRFQQKGAA